MVRGPPSHFSPLTSYLSSMSPGDCLLTGLCGAQQLAAAPPPGLMFLALGLVLYGIGGLWRARQRR